MDTRWAARIGLARAFRAFDAPGELLDRFFEEQRTRDRPVCLLIDKDVPSIEVARTNRGQGVLDTELMSAIGRLRGRLIGSGSATYPPGITRRGGNANSARSMHSRRSKML